MQPRGARLPLRRLFVYGSLLTGDAPAPLRHALTRYTRPLGAASIAARLYHLGRYPGAVPDPDGRVHGELRLLINPKKVLYLIDKYEEYDVHDHAASEFLRVAVAARLTRAPLRQVLAWTYFYHRSVSGRRRIGSDDYTRWRR